LPYIHLYGDMLTLYFVGIHASIEKTRYEQQRRISLMNLKNKYLKPAVAISISSMIFLSGHALAASSTLHLNSRGSEVTALQQQLKQLGCYPSNLITGFFGSITRDAVIRFQKSKGLQADGIVGTNTYARLGSNATTSNRGASTPVKTNQTLKHGARGTAVQELQRSLLTDGFYHFSIDGIFGNGTETAVKALQRSKGLQADGIVGPATLNALAGKSLSSRGGSSANRTTQSGTNEKLSWNVVDPLFARKSTARVIDVDTGKSFMIHRYGGIKHADVEPLTANDTAIMKEIYGGAWSWARRAIIVETNGRRIAASMNGMPHGGHDIGNNNFGGQFCVHFLNSRTHGTNNLDPDHQAMVRKAAASHR